MLFFSVIFLQPAIDKVNQEARAINTSLTRNQQAANTIQGEVEIGRQEMYGKSRPVEVKTCWVTVHSFIHTDGWFWP